MFLSNILFGHVSPEACPFFMRRSPLSGKFRGKNSFALLYSLCRSFSKATSRASLFPAAIHRPQYPALLRNSPGFGVK
jgi:hypothetical protein